jgi:hypothetical protein
MGSSSLSHALVFNFTPAPGTSAQAIAGFQAAGDRWSALFSDNITVNINIAFAPLSPGVLASANSTQAAYTYASVRTALTNDASSPTDATAVANLPATSVPMMINRTSNSPNGSGSATPYLDNNGSANNTTLRLSNANAKALGLLAANNSATDANISFSTLFTWDFDPTNGILNTAFDFIGVATHEIGHAMGFLSGVDILDINSPPVNGPFLENQFTFVSPLDLFRYSALSDANNAIDWTADTRAKYFSIDGGTTVGAGFSTGRNFGDGQQASHWKDSLGLGALDPTAARGERVFISGNDLTALDAIGYNRIPDNSSSLVLMSIMFIALGSLRRWMKSSPAAG